MQDFSAAKARLAAQLEELELRHDHIMQDQAEPLSQDSSERATETEDDISLEAQRALVAAEIASVNRALLRIEHGTYGECVRCGQVIDPRRLDARPEAALCLPCAAREP